MGRRKIDIVRIENERHRQVTFTKRKSGLIKKATELAILCEAQVGVIIFSANDKMSVFSSAPIEGLLERFRDYQEAPEVRRARYPLLGLACLRLACRLRAPRLHEHEHDPAVLCPNRSFC